tara:strand:- start:129 stop:893 length:765 start_codon:yes stop_codon:yes gene_type:complete
MKKFLLTVTLALLFIGTRAQCTPDPQFIIAGIYPDSATGLKSALVGQAYNEIITIVVPSDTVVDVFGSMLSVAVDKIDLTSVSGLPNNFSYDCDPPNCSFPGGTVKCATLYSDINPTMDDVGLYPIVFETTTHVSGIPILNTTTQDDAIDYYYLEITSTTSVINQYSDYTFDLKDIFPNPLNNIAKIQFISGNAKDVVFTVFNHLGEKIEERNINANRGVNDIEVYANNYASGMYLYSINNGVQILSKRMIIEN